jgi:hypothetical protein
MTKPSRFPATRNAKGAGKQTLDIPIDLSSFDELISAIEDDVAAAVRPAAQAGAEVFYQAVLKNVNAIGKVTGSLAGSIYQKYSEDKSGPGRAVYHVSWRTSDAALDANGQRIRTGLPTAPHGHLIEFGHIQRYAVHLGEDGLWHTLVRPSMRGKPRPKSKASQAVKDAYYVLRPGGPKQVGARPFMRPAFYRQGEAFAAVQAKFFDVLGKK